MGAASFGANPSLFIQRCSKLTYGTDCIFPFEDGVDPESKQIPKAVMRELYDSNYDGCVDRFSIFVPAKFPVPTDAVVRRRYGTGKLSKSKPIPIKFYATAKENPRYCDEDGVTEIASVDLFCPFVSDDPSKQYIELEMYFGQSEIIAYAIEPISGTKERVDFRFSAGY
jgi:hypothetical protein